MMKVNSLFLLVLFISTSTIIQQSNGQRLSEVLFNKERTLLQLANKVKEYYSKRCEYSCECSIHSCYSEMDSTQMNCTQEYGGDVSNKCSCSKKKLINFVEPTFRYSYGVPGNKEALCWMKQMKQDLIRSFSQEKTSRRVYVSSQDGTMLTYPGSTQFCSESRYDARIRPWFVSATTGPKSVILILDVSGSMEGVRLEMMKEAAISLINTLSLGDFLSVVTFSTNSISLTGSYFITVNDKNKAEISKNIKSLIALGSTNFYQGFSLGSSIIRSSLNTDSYSNCSLSIIFLTDGIPTDDPVRSKSELSNLAKTVDFRLFTFSFGESADTVITKDLACGFNGIWTPVISLDTLPVQMSNILDYFSVINSEGNGRVFWSDVYEDASGAGQMITGSTAVYYTHINNNYPDLIAVVAIDILIADIQEIEPNYENFLKFLLERNSICYKFQLDECLLWKVRAKNYTNQLESTQTSYNKQCQTNMPTNCSISLTTECSPGVPSRVGTVCGQLFNEPIPLSEKEYKKGTCCSCLTEGALAGIIVSVCVFAILIIILIIVSWLIHKKRIRKRRESGQVQMNNTPPAYSSRT